VGRASRDKGNRAEREVAKILSAKRVPLSGAAGGEYAGDVVDELLGRGEVKRRKDGFKLLYKWLEGNDFLCVRADRKDWLIVMKLEKIKALKGAGNK